MLITFLSILALGFIVLVGGSIFGHDSEIDHDLGGHDVHGHDGDHDSVVSIFSTKVLGTFVLGFGGAGAIATYYGLPAVLSSCAGIAAGFVMGAIMYAIMKGMYGHQANSLVSINDLVDQTGIVITPIDEGTVGEVTVSLGSQTLTYTARGNAGRAISKGRNIRVVATMGSQLLVEEVN